MPRTKKADYHKNHVRMSLEKLKEAGGDRKSFRLSPRAHRALKYISNNGSDKDMTAIVNRLLVVEHERMRSLKKSNNKVSPLLD